MTRIVLGISLAFFAVCLIACGGGGTEQGAANTRKGGGSTPEKLPDEERLAAALKIGDKVVLDAPTEFVICGRDLDALCEYNRHLIVWDVAPEELLKDSTPSDRKLYGLLQQGRLVRVKTGTVGEVVEEEGSTPINRTQVKPTSIVLNWIKVRFDVVGAVFVPKNGLEKR